MVMNYNRCLWPMISHIAWHGALDWLPVDTERTRFGSTKRVAVEAVELVKLLPSVEDDEENDGTAHCINLSPGTSLSHRFACPEICMDG